MNSGGLQQIETVRFEGRVPYADALLAQDERRVAVEEGHLPNALFLLEHAPVITLGVKAHRENILLSDGELAAMGIEVLETTRGGDVTYHGPGQLVAYPILNLKLWRPSIGWYLRSLEEIVIRQVAAYGLKPGRKEGFTGVWVDDAKVASIGVGVHKWVTYHGVALNVDPDMSRFQLIIPCGIADRPATSIKELLGHAPTMTQAMGDFEREFRDYFVSTQQGRTD